MKPSDSLIGLADPLLRLARAAGDVILDVYGQPFDVDRKIDRSPVTAADRRADRLLVNGLSEIESAWPVLSEEGGDVAWDVRRRWVRYWLVDPLDGTREFVARNDQFTVNIALIDRHYPLLGVIHEPVSGTSWYGGANYGSVEVDRCGGVEAIRARPAQSETLHALVSRSHLDPRVTDWLRQRGPYRTSGVGSSLKFCRLARGDADVYPRFGPTSEWDTAAGQAILEGAGGAVRRLDGARLAYNCKPALINPDFIASADPNAPLDWSQAPETGLQ